MITVTTCPICGNTNLRPYLTCIDYTVSKEAFSLAECSTCTLVLTTPRPDITELPAYYESVDYISHTSRASNLTNILYLMARKFTLRSKQKLVTEIQPEKGKILDIGCGTGDFLKTCLQNGWNVTGVED